MATRTAAPDFLDRTSEGQDLEVSEAVTAPTPLFETPRDRDRRIRRERTAELFHRVHADDTTEAERENAYNELIEINMCVADAIANRYRHRGVAEEDLRQVAYVALIRCVRKFDLSHDRDFLSFAVPTMNGELKRHFRDHGWMVRPPRRIQETQALIRRYLKTAYDPTGQRPSDIAEAIGASVEDVTEALAADGCFAPLSTDRVHDETGTSLLDFVSFDTGGYDHVENRETVHTLIAGLADRDQQILYWRFFEDMTQEQIGERLGISQMQVSRLLARIMRDLREKADTADPSTLFAAA